ncbi:chaperone protein dnaJ 20, chloroplastic-like [Gastrolobium bilobum]|uniref:chaperone protein dnaJ 20, chloroplastic-like n=1 Tax=Gastrolobium bilobum TaxID=150636 RepID=UPI002AAF6D44|nr:chaperone protein dnaJ 20, chloroplastic-like [Gastrolobium bilobum]
MEYVISLSSSLSISKPFHFFPLSNKHQRHPRMKFGVSCRATKLSGVDETSHVNFYKILCLSPKSATMDDIKRAYRSMALLYHPDVCQDRSKKEESTRMFVQLNAAYKTLSNPKLRADYDYDLGLRSKMSASDESWRCRWQEQMVELKRRSHRRMAQKGGGSWGSRMRAQNMKDHTSS